MPIPTTATTPLIKPVIDTGCSGNAPLALEVAAAEALDPAAEALEARPLAPPVALALTADAADWPAEEAEAPTEDPEAAAELLEPATLAETGRAEAIEAQVEFWSWRPMAASVAEQLAPRHALAAAWNC